MRCTNPECGREHQNAKGVCPHCLTPTQLAETQEEGGFSLTLDVLGHCLQCSQEVTGMRLKSSPKTAELYGWKSTTTFLPGRHLCAKVGPAS